jgi:hypothetical protein
MLKNSSSKSLKKSRKKKKEEDKENGTFVSWTASTAAFSTLNSN